MNSIQFTPTQLRNYALVATNQQHLLTLGDIDLTESSEELDYILDRIARGHCTSLEFNDINRKHGCKCIEYNVVTDVYTGGYDRNEDGVSAETEKYACRIWVPVHDEMTLEEIACSIAAEVLGIDGNRFA